MGKQEVAEEEIAEVIGDEQEAPDDEEREEAESTEEEDTDADTTPDSEEADDDEAEEEEAAPEEEEVGGEADEDADEDEDEEPSYAERYQALTDTLKEYGLGAPRATPASQESPQTAETPKAKEEEQPKDSLNFDFIDENTFTQAVTDPASFRQVMQNVARASAEHMMRNMVSPVEEMIKDQVAVQAAQARIREHFYAKNPDLEEFALIVQQVAGEVESEGNAKNLQQVLNETENRVRKKLKMPRKRRIVESDTNRGGSGSRKPRGGAGKAARKSAKKGRQPSMQDEINDLIDLE